MQQICGTNRFHCQDLQNNGTMYLHLVAARNEAQINPLHPQHNKHDVVVTSRSMYQSFNSLLLRDIDCPIKLHYIPLCLSIGIKMIL